MFYNVFGFSRLSVSSQHLQSVNNRERFRSDAINITVLCAIAHSSFSHAAVHCCTNTLRMNIFGVLAFRCSYKHIFKAKLIFFLMLQQQSSFWSKYLCLRKRSNSYSTIYGVFILLTNENCKKTILGRKNVGLCLHTWQRTNNSFEQTSLQSSGRTKICSNLIKYRDTWQRLKVRSICKYGSELHICNYKTSHQLIEEHKHYSLDS